jgi:hypothetical protein
MAVKDGSDTATDQIDKYVLFPPLFLPFVVRRDFEFVLTKRSISDETNRTIHQLKTQSARIQVCKKMERHQYWKAHNRLQKEVQRILHCENDGENIKEENDNPFGRDRREARDKSRHGVYTNRIKEIIRLIGCQWAFRST